MAQILQNKNSATRFQIMVEIAAYGPNIRQRSIAGRLGVSPQAISDYIKQLAGEGLIDTTGRSSYRVSVKGVNWILKMLRELNDYVSEATKAITNITVCAAVADSDLKKGQVVGLRMRDGLLVATARPGSGARGIAATGAKKGEDVGVSNVDGLVKLTRGKITILEVPTIQEGGSSQTNLKQLKAYSAKNQQVGAIGIEAITALRRASVEPRYLFGVVEAAIEEAKCGLSFLIVCTTDAIAGLIKKLQENGLDYEIISLALKEHTPATSV